MRGTLGMGTRARQPYPNTGDLLAAGEDLRTICEEENASLLVMDPLSGAFVATRTTEPPFMILFHHSEDGEITPVCDAGNWTSAKSAEGRAAGFSGSTAWEASTRSMWLLSKKSISQETGKTRGPTGHLNTQRATIQHYSLRYL